MENITNKNRGILESCKRIAELALPMAGTQFISVSSGFLCMAMVAQLGPQVFAASALIFSTEFSIMVTGISFLLSLSVLVGHAYGGKDHCAIGVFVQQGWTLGILISIPIMIIFWHIKKILIFFGQSKEISEIIEVYFRAFMWCVIPEFLSVCNQQFGYGIHKKFLIVSASIISVAVLLLTAYVLIFGKLGFPRLGITGLGFARVAQNLFFFVFTTLFFYYEKSFERFELFRYRVHHHLDHFVKMFKIGWPISIQLGGEMLSFFVSGIMMGWLGIIALSASQVVNQYYFLIIIPIATLAQASGILVGHACGAKQFQEVKKLTYTSIGLALVVSGIVAAAFLLFPKKLASFYMEVNNPLNAKTLHLTIILFVIIAFSQMFDAIRHVLIGILRGLFDTQFSMYMSLFTIWIIGMPLSYLLAFPLHWGAIGFVTGGMLGMIAGVVIMAYRWSTLSKKY